MGNRVISSPTERGKRGWEDRQFKVMAHPPTPTPWNHCIHLNLTAKWILGRKGHLLNIYTITTQLKHRIFGILPWWWIPLVKIYFLNCEFRIVVWLPRVVWYIFLRRKINTGGGSDCSFFPPFLAFHSGYKVSVWFLSMFGWLQQRVDNILIKYKRDAPR